MSTTRVPILLVEAATIRMSFTGSDAATHQQLNGVNMGPVDTNLSKPTQSLIASVLGRDLPGLGYTPEFGFFDGKTLPLKQVGQDLPILLSAGYAAPRRSIDYAGGKIDVFTLGKTLDTIADQLQDFPIMGITANFTFESSMVVEAITCFKRHNPRGKVVVGGRDATFRPKVYLTAGADAVIRGEGETIAARLFVELLEKRDPSTPGVIYRSLDPFGQVVAALRAPIQDLPLPYFFSGGEVLRPDLPGDQLKYYVESQDGPLPEGVNPPVFHFFTSRGCPNGCSFCPTAGMKQDRINLAQVDSLLGYLRGCGVHTLISAEDAFLERVISMGREQGRDEIMAIMEMIRKHGFSIEWANGIDFNILWDGGSNQLDIELLDSVFSHHMAGDRWNGTYRMLTPVERPSGDSKLHKLVNSPTQVEIISAIVSRHLTPSQGITWILRPEDTPSQIEEMKRRVQEIQREITRTSEGRSTSRLGMFCLMPNPGCADAKLERYAAYPIEEYPELRHYFLSVLDGQELGGMPHSWMFWRRLQILRELDPGSYQTWMTQGGYQR